MICCISLLCGEYFGGNGKLDAYVTSGIIKSRSRVLKREFTVRLITGKCIVFEVKRVAEVDRHDMEFGGSFYSLCDFARNTVKVALDKKG